MTKIESITVFSLLFTTNILALARSVITEDPLFAVAHGVLALVSWAILWTVWESDT